MDDVLADFQKKLKGIEMDQSTIDMWKENCGRDTAQPQMKEAMKNIDDKLKRITEIPEADIREIMLGNGRDSRQM